MELLFDLKTLMTIIKSDLFVNLLASFIWFILGYVFYYGSRLFIVIKPTKRLWKIKDPKSLIIVAATSAVTDTGHYERPATGIGQMRALGYAIESLNKAYEIKIQNIFLSKDHIHNLIENDLIILGGPKNNAVAKLFLDKLLSNNVVIANQEGNVIKWLLQNKEKDFTAEEKNKDYGLIIRAKNPFGYHKNTSICLFTGCHTYGTMAAAKYFTNNYVKKFRGVKRHKENVALIIQCDVQDGFTVGEKIVNGYEHEF
jgi:hypothetical protein